VSGTVFGPADTGPVDGVEVRLNLSATAVTHDGGQFAFTALTLGTYTLSAYVDGRLRAQDKVKLDGAQATKDLVLVGVGTVTGTVTLWRRPRGRGEGPPAERRADLRGPSTRRRARTATTRSAAFPSGPSRSAGPWARTPGRRRVQSPSTASR
jgi:hypothetical protein